MKEKNKNINSISLPPEFKVPSSELVTKKQKFRTSLIMAFRNEPLETLVAITTKFPQIWKCVYSGASPIHFSVLNPDDQVLDFTIKKYQELSLDINIECTENRAGSYTKKENIGTFIGDTAINIALKINNYQKLKKIIDSGGNKIGTLYKNYNIHENHGLTCSFKCVDGVLCFVPSSYYYKQGSPTIKINEKEKNDLFSFDNDYGLLKLSIPSYLLATNNFPILFEMFSKNESFIDGVFKDMQSLEKVISGLSKEKSLKSNGEMLVAYNFFISLYGAVSLNSLFLLENNRDKTSAFFSYLYTDALPFFFNTISSPISRPNDFSLVSINNKSIVNWLNNINNHPGILQKHANLDPIAEIKKNKSIALTIKILQDIGLNRGSSNTNNKNLISFFENLLVKEEIYNLSLNKKSKKDNFKL